MRAGPLAALGVLGIPGVLLTPPTLAQSLSPMHAEIAAASGTAAVHLTAGNPGARRMTLTVSAYESDWTPLVGAAASRARLEVPPGETSRFLVAVPMEDGARRDFRVCVTAAPRSSRGGQAVRGQVCGRYVARRTP